MISLKGLEFQKSPLVFIFQVKWFIGAFVNENYTQMSRPHQFIIQCLDDLNLHLLGARVAQQLKSLGRCEH